jgi:hypothetical protein
MLQGLAIAKPCFIAGYMTDLVVLLDTLALMSFLCPKQKRLWCLPYKLVPIG